MFKADTSTLGECFTADPGRDAGLRAGNGEPEPPFHGRPVP